MGYILEIEGIKYYIAGDTDITEDNRSVKCDVAFVPVGGTYTMSGKQENYKFKEVHKSWNNNKTQNWKKKQIIQF